MWSNDEEQVKVKGVELVLHVLAPRPFLIWSGWWTQWRGFTLRSLDQLIVDEWMGWSCINIRILWRPLDHIASLRIDYFPIIQGQTHACHGTARISTRTFQKQAFNGAKSKFKTFKSNNQFELIIYSIDLWPLLSLSLYFDRSLIHLFN